MGFWRGRVAAVFCGGLVVWGPLATGGCGQILGIHILGDEPDGSDSGGPEGAGGTGTASGGKSSGSTSTGAGGAGGGSTSTGAGGTGGVGICFSCTGALWNQVLSGTEGAYLYGIAVDDQSNVVFVGAFNGNSDFKGACLNPVAASCPMISAGEEDVYIVKLDKNGTPVWMKHAGDSAGWQYAYDVAIDTMGNIIPRRPRTLCDNPIGSGEITLDPELDVSKRLRSASNTAALTKEYLRPHGASVPGTQLEWQHSKIPVLVGR